MPAISEAARDAARALLDEIGHAEFHARLAARDPVLGAKLKVGDTQRILRAWEVVEATGRPLSAWQADAPEPPIAATFQGIAILPPREVLNAAGDTRFEGMLATGALEEVRALRATGIAEVAPIWRVLGARPLIQHIQGEIDLKAAAGLAKTATRQYAKRQTTWFRHHFDARLIISEQYSERLLPDIFPKVRNSG